MRPRRSNASSARWRATRALSRYRRPTISRFSRPVSISSTAAYCPARPMTERTAVGRSTTSRPATRAVPASGRINVASTFTSVVLPAPFGPRSPSTLAAGTSRSTPSSARVVPKDFATPCTSIIGPFTDAVMPSVLAAWVPASLPRCDRAVTVRIHGRHRPGRGRPPAHHHAGGPEAPRPHPRRSARAGARVHPGSGPGPRRREHPALAVAGGRRPGDEGRPGRPVPPRLRPVHGRAAGRRRHLGPQRRGPHHVELGLPDRAPPGRPDARHPLLPRPAPT